MECSVVEKVQAETICSSRGVKKSKAKTKKPEDSKLRLINEVVHFTKCTGMYGSSKKSMLREQRQPHVLLKSVV